MNDHIVRPPSYYLIRAGSAEQRYRAAFCQGGTDALRQAYRLTCPSCRLHIIGLAAKYHFEWEAT